MREKKLKFFGIGIWRILEMVRPRPGRAWGARYKILNAPSLVLAISFKLGIIMVVQKFKFINGYFDKVYVLTLKRASERIEHFQKELEGLQYEIFYGQDKELFNVEALKRANIYNEFLARKHHRYGKSMPPGMIGCSWSHKLIYEDIVSHNYQKALILEDDIVIDHVALSILQEAWMELSPDWDLVYLGFAGNEKTPLNGSLKKLFYHFLRIFKAIKFSHKTIDNLYPKKVSKHIFSSGYHDCTHAYGITQNCAKKLIDLQTPISFFPDNLLAYAATREIIKAFIIQPRIFYQQYQVLNKPIVSYIND
ncbi:MAG: hypothetical protein NVS1B13_09500 [Flavisolibacter sp.]